MQLVLNISELFSVFQPSPNNDLVTIPVDCIIIESLNEMGITFHTKKA